MTLYRVYAIVMIKWSIRTPNCWCYRTLFLGDFKVNISAIDNLEYYIFFWSYLAIEKAKRIWKTTSEAKVTLSIFGKDYGRRALIHVDLIDKKFKLRVYEKEGVFRNYLRFRRGKRKTRLIIEKQPNILLADYDLPTHNILEYVGKMLPLKSKPEIVLKKIKHEFKPVF